MYNTCLQYGTNPYTTSLEPLNKETTSIGALSNRESL